MQMSGFGDVGLGWFGVYTTCFGGVDRNMLGFNIILALGCSFVFKKTCSRFS